MGKNHRKDKPEEDGMEEGVRVKPSCYPPVEHPQQASYKKPYVASC
jgi:hypothetical protein